MDVKRVSEVVCDPDDISYDPWTVAVHALAMQAAGLELTEGEKSAVYVASEMLAVTALVNGGMPLQSVMRQFEEREHVVHLTYDKATDDIGITIDWADDEAGR